jgi:hypothetical protein
MNFGDTLKAIIVYLRDENRLPYERIKSLVNDVFGIKISTATIVNAVKDAENSITIENYEEAAS